MKNISDGIERVVIDTKPGSIEGFGGIGAGGDVIDGVHGHIGDGGSSI